MKEDIEELHKGTTQETCKMKCARNAPETLLSHRKMVVSIIKEDQARLKMLDQWSSKFCL